MGYRALAIGALNFDGALACKVPGITQDLVLQDGLLNRENSFQKVFKITVFDNADDVGGRERHPEVFFQLDP